VSQDGWMLYVVNSKDVAGPNPSGGRSTEAGIARNTTFKNEYVMALQKAGISTIPVPGPQDLAALSKQVDGNNGFKQPGRGQYHQMMKFLQRNIKHVVYIIKENRTYDQVLGDLPIGNGDPELALFPEPISPNHHKLAMEFVTFDNFYASGSVSGDGWGWSTFARTTDYTEKTVSVIYGNAGFQGLTYDFEGNNRFILPAVPETSPNPTPITARLTSLLDPTGSSAILPGDRDLSAPAGTSDINPQAKGDYLWDSALRASKTSLQGRTDIYFRGYDQKMTDIFSFNEWKRDLEAYIAQNGTLPNLIAMALDHDHFGSFSNAVAGVNTPSLQMADNDYALGLLVEYLSNRPEWKQTAIFVIEDDAQNGPDHVDAFRTLAYIISPYTRRGGELISTNYNTVNMIRTMEDVLGIEYLGINDANALPMSDAFTKSPDLTPYTAILPGNLCEDPVDTDLLGIAAACNDSSIPKTASVKSRHNASWWAEAFKDFDFEELDNLDSEAFNLVLWAGIKGEHIPYPVHRSGADLRKNRKQLIAQWRQSAGHIAVDGIGD
jgi:DNA-binding beta-propeller fold protein YncE